MMSGARPDYTGMLAEYRGDLAWARTRLGSLPPAYAEAILAVIAKCDAAITLVEQVAAAEWQQADVR